MKISILCLFPDELRAYFSKGILGKAQSKGLFVVDFINIRDFAAPKHFKVDDYPVAHRTGMLLKVDVLYKAITSIEGYEKSKIIYTSPQGQPLTHGIARKFQKEMQDIIIIAGYYEGIDERLFDLLQIVSVSIGDVVLTSGELPALVIAEALVRFIPGVLGNDVCVDDESLHSGLLEYPQYTQPKEFMGKTVPDVLTSGHHGKVQEWETAESLKKTLYKRPDLMAKNDLGESEKNLVTKLLSHLSS